MTQIQGVSILSSAFVDKTYLPSHDIAWHSSQTWNVSGLHSFQELSSCYSHQSIFFFMLQQLCLHLRKCEHSVLSKQ